MRNGSGPDTREAITVGMIRPMPSRGASTLSLEELIRACIDTGDAASWEEFVRRTHVVISATALRTARRYGGSSPALLSDLVQEAYLRICDNRCRVLREFKAEVPEAIFGLLKTIAFSVTHDHFRAEFSTKRGTGAPDRPLDALAENATASRADAPAIEQEILLKEIGNYLAAEKGVAERRIFWLYYRHGMTSRAIAAIPGICLSQKGVESTVHRLTALVRNWIAENRHTDQKAKGKGSGSAL